MGVSWDLSVDVDDPLQLSFIVGGGVLGIVEQELSLSVLSGDGVEAGLDGSKGGEVAGVQEGLMGDGGSLSLGNPNTDLGVLDGRSVFEVVDGDSDGLELDVSNSWEGSCLASSG